MISYVILGITLLFFTIASIQDFKKKEIYDYINFFYAIIILVISIIYSIHLNSFDPIKYAGFGLMLSFILGGILYLLGIWGGGDAKFLMGFGASTPYLIEFTSSMVPTYALNFLLEKTSFYLNAIIDITTIYIVSINIFVLCLLFIFISKKRERQILYNALNLCVVLILLTLGFFIQVDPFILFIWGFFAFAITFFADDYLMDSLYIRVKKKVSYLEKNDVLDGDFKSKEVFYSQETFMDGVPRNILAEIKSTEKKIVVVRKIFPMGMLILLNFIIFGVKILSIDILNLEMMAFLLKFILTSFLVGGVLIIGMILLFIIKNPKKISKSFSKTEQYLFLLLVISITSISLFIHSLGLLLAIFLLYFFFKISKLFEDTMFVLKRPLSSLVPGDWIMQDIVVGGKTYFKVEDFKLGVEEEQLKKINTLSKKEPKLKNILVKDGIAFLPPMFIAFLLLIFL